MQVRLKRKLQGGQRIKISADIIMGHLRQMDPRKRY